MERSASIFALVSLLGNHMRVYPKVSGLAAWSENWSGSALCHWMQLYRYFVSQYSEFCRHNPLCCFSASVYCCKRIFLYRLSPEIFWYTLVYDWIHMKLCVRYLQDLSPCGATVVDNRKVVWCHTPPSLGREFNDNEKKTCLFLTYFHVLLFNDFLLKICVVSRSR
jgi:hypothetical protein